MHKKKETQYFTEDKMSQIDDILMGAVDLHIHCGPDTIKRKLDVISLAKKAKDAKMKGVVVKSHALITSQIAEVTQKIVKDISVFGAVTLNESVGGLNLEAVKAGVATGAKVIWLPTVSAKNHIEKMKKREGDTHLGKLSQATKGITILNKNGSLKKEVIKIIEMVKEADVILGTGHISPFETEVLAIEANKMDFKKMVVTHPELYITWMDKEIQKKIKDYGVYFERTFYPITKIGGSLDPLVIIKNIKEVGVKNTILSTDLGQIDNPDPIEGFKEFIEILLNNGITIDEIEIMIKENPKRLLNI